MKLRNVLQVFPTLAFISVLALSGARPVLAQSDGSLLVRGWFSIIWGDDRVGLYSPAPAYMLTDDDGHGHTLLIDEALAASAGGVLALDRQRVTVRATQRFAPADQGSQVSLQVESIALDTAPDGVTANNFQPLVSGSQPFISIMCKFQDVAATPKALPYFQNMYSNTFPGLDNYWRQASYNTVNIVGSTAVGWYTLPHPHAYYMSGTNFNLYNAAVDCTAAADPAVNFAPFKGINLMFNADLDCCAWGGGQYLTLDGVSKFWPMTWEPPWGYNSITAISHEMGHAFGLPHSSGTYGETYDNRWDVMSNIWTDCSRSTSATYGCLGQGTISYHKDKLGWIPPAQKFTAGWGTNATITLERLAQPITANYLMAQIPIAGSSTHFYTVEVRRRIGYDVKLPGPAVIIHDVDITRLRPANVIDADGNGNTGDAGAMWNAGETFLDAANGISVKVLSATASGFQVKIQTPTVVTFNSVGANDGMVLESGEDTSLGGSLNSAATFFNVGDDLANKQFRDILHFDTSSLPDTAVIVKATLKIEKQGLVGTDPFTTHGALLADIHSTYFGTTAGLAIEDFQAASSNLAAATFGAPVGNLYRANLTSLGKSYINRLGPTQFRLRFALDDNNDLGADYAMFFSGNAPLANQPQLIIQYTLP